jgi:hypothetical protein
MANSSRQEKDERKFLWEDRILRAAFVAGLLATLLLLIAISTSKWVTVEYQHSVLYNHTNIGRGEFFKTGHYHGLWRICRQEYVNTTDEAPHESKYYAGDLCIIYSLFHVDLYVSCSHKHADTMNTSAA